MTPNNSLNIITNVTEIYSSKAWLKLTEYYESIKDPKG